MIGECGHKRLRKEGIGWTHAFGLIVTSSMMCYRELERKLREISRSMGNEGQARQRQEGGRCRLRTKVTHVLAGRVPPEPPMMHTHTTDESACNNSPRHAGSLGLCFL